MWDKQFTTTPETMVNLTTFSRHSSTGKGWYYMSQWACIEKLSSIYIQPRGQNQYVLCGSYLKKRSYSKARTYKSKGRWKSIHTSSNQRQTCQTLHWTSLITQELSIAGQNGQNLNNTFCSVSRDREVLAAFLKESWRLYGKLTVFFPQFEQPGGTS